MVAGMRRGMNSRAVQVQQDTWGTGHRNQAKGAVTPGPACGRVLTDHRILERRTTCGKKYASERLLLHRERKQWMQEGPGLPVLSALGGQEAVLHAAREAG